MSQKGSERERTGAKRAKIVTKFNIKINIKIINVNVLEHVKIKIDSYLIRGSEALLSHENEKLQIYGNPATISSSAIDGQAEVFEIFPNKSMNLIGNARLSSEGNIITSNLITYQISSNE